MRRVSVLRSGLAIIFSAIGCSRPSPIAATTTTARPAVDTTIQRDNDRFVRQILAQIGERASLPAGQVFVNVTGMTTPRADVFLQIMNGGFARALGVRCTYCHVETNFSSDEKRPKRAAREMAAMHRMINGELRKMENLASAPAQNRAINCSTCHRGVINPLSTDR